MIHNSEVVDNLQHIPDGKFDLWLVSVTLTLGEEEIKGTGRILQEAGSLMLHLVNADLPGPGVDLFDLFSDDGVFEHLKRKSGESYYKMEAIDEHGHQVYCQHVDIAKAVKKRIYRVALASNLIITSTGPAVRFDSAAIVFRNRYNFDTNQSFQKRIKASGLLSDQFGSFRQWQQKIDEMELVLHRDLPRLQLDVTGEGIEETTVKRLIDALDFTTAQEHRSYYKVYYKDYTSHFKAVIPVKDYAISNSILMAPYGPSGPYGDVHEFNHLLMNYYYFFLKNNPDAILTKWHKRLVDAGTGYHYRFGLVLGIAVEKLLKKYYPVNQNPVKFPANDLELIVKLSETLANEILAKKVKAIVDNLNNAPSYVPRQMLALLEEKKIISSGGKKAWEESRNKYAHGSDHNNDLSTGMDYTLEVLTLYYELIFHKIGYQGKYINYFADKSGKVVNYILASEQ